MLRYYTGAVRKIAALIQMFATDQNYVEVVGENRLPQLQQWNRHAIAGKFAFRVNPNSALRIDQAQAQTQAMKRYELLRKDPNVNGVELLDGIAESSDLDRAKLIIPQVPPKPPDQPNISFRFNAADLDVRNPNFPIYLAILKKAGYDVLDQPEVDPKTGMAEPAPTEQALQYARLQSQAGSMAHTSVAPDPLASMEVPPPAAVIAGHSNHAMPDHGGAAPTADHISRHRAAETGHDEGKPPLVR